MVFCLGQKKVLAATDGEVNLDLWTLGEINNAGEATLTDYRIDNSLKSIVVPNAVDFIQSDSSRYGSLQKVYITRLTMNKAAKNGDKSGGSLKISDTGTDNNNFDVDKTKVFAEGEDWSNAFSGNGNSFGGSFIYDIEEIDLSRFDTRNITNMESMFRSICKLKTLNLSNFNTENVTNMGYMFWYSNKIEELDVSSFDTSSVENMQYMFASCYELTKLNLGDSFNTSNVINMNSMFFESRKLTELDLSKFNTEKVENMTAMFQSCSGLTSLDLSNFDTSKVNLISCMFQNCSSLTSLDLSNFDTSNVTNMASMFYGCSGLTNLDLSNFNTSNVNSYSAWRHSSGNYGMSKMFADCSNLRKLILGDKFDTSKVTDMSYMFSGCRMLKNIIGISDFDVSSAKYVEHMFDGCNFKNEINFRSWQPTNVSYMYGMYKDYIGHGDLYLDSFDAGNLDIKYGLVNGDKDYGAEGIFRNSHNLLYLDLSSFNLNHLERNNSYDKIFATDDEEGRQEPLLITTNDEFLTELTTLRNNCQNRTLFTTTLKVDGENVAFRVDPNEENVTYNADKTEKYINIYTTYTTKDTKEEILKNLAERLEDEKKNLIVVPGYENIEWEPEKETEGKVSYSLQNVYTIKKLEPEEKNYGWSTIENSGGSSGGGSSSSSINQDLISKNESTDTKTQAQIKSDLPEQLRTRKYLIGYDDEKIKPENYVTNAEFVTVIYRLMNNGETINYDRLEDIGVKKSDWFANAVAYLIDDSRQIINITDKNFRPNENIKGYEVMNIIHNVLKFYGANKNFAIDQDLNSNVTRAKMSEIIFKAFDRKNSPGEKIYLDLDKNHWAYNFLMDASE